MITGGYVVRSAGRQRIPLLIDGTTSVREFAPDIGGVVLETLKLPVGTQDDHGHG
jgi:hypothetical protein